jgi:hypothetical protein
MAEEYGVLLRITFIIHVIIGFIFGLGFLMIPAYLAPMFGIAFSDPTVRLFGAMMVAFTIGSLLCLMTKEWARVKVVVEMELVWTVLGPIVIGYHILFPPFYNYNAWINVGILLVLFFLFLISYVREVRK